MKCDELKYEKLGDMMPFYPRSTLVIRKQFVDAAIAELKKEKEYVIEHTAEVINAQERELSRQKYKRCMAKAEVLEHVCPMTNRKAKWHKRWLEIGQQFKEAK